MARADLEAIFGGDEPLREPGQRGRFRALLGLGDDARPFECVGDIDECRAAVLLAASARTAPRAATSTGWRAEVAGSPATAHAKDATTLLLPRAPHHIPERYAPTDLLVRAR